MNTNRVVELLEQVIKAVKEVQPVSPVVKSARFSVLNDGWIFDRVLGLEWGLTSKKDLNFEEANRHCADLGGRMPTLKELHSLVDYDRYEPSTDSKVFEDTKSSWYWASTPYKSSPDCAWCVYFGNGSVYGNRKCSHIYVRPVRASQIGINP